MLQAQQLQAEAERQVAHLNSSLKQSERQAAALSSDKERLHAQLLQRQAAAATGAPVGAPLQNIPQVSLTVSHAYTKFLVLSYCSLCVMYHVSLLPWTCHKVRTLQCCGQSSLPKEILLSVAAIT